MLHRHAGARALARGRRHHRRQWFRERRARIRAWKLRLCPGTARRNLRGWFRRLQTGLHRLELKSAVPEKLRNVIQRVISLAGVSIAARALPHIVPFAVEVEFARLVT